MRKSFLAAFLAAWMGAGVGMGGEAGEGPVVYSSYGYHATPRLVIAVKGYTAETMNGPRTLVDDLYVNAEGEWGGFDRYALSKDIAEAVKTVIKKHEERRRAQP